MQSLEYQQSLCLQREHRQSLKFREGIQAEPSEYSLLRGNTASRSHSIADTSPPLPPQSGHPQIGTSPQSGHPQIWIPHPNQDIPKSGHLTPIKTSPNQDTSHQSAQPQIRTPHPNQDIPNLDTPKSGHHIIIITIRKTDDTHTSSPPTLGCEN
jgi:hypothetical protein